MSLPKRIEVCPIVDYIIEVRFSSKIYSSAIFGIIYNTLKEDFQKVEKLPILQLPEQLREEDPAFQFKPHYKITDGKYAIQIGPKVISISSPMPYIGWEEFSKIVYMCLEKVFRLELIEKVHRLGIRVINFFDEIDIFNNVDLALHINQEKKDLLNTTVRIEIPHSSFKNTLQITNNANRTNENGSITNGSVIDIDTHKNYEDESFLKNYISEINEGHDVEKEFFFSLLKGEFLKSLKPVY